MAIWTAEIKEIERVNEPLKGQFPELGKELIYLIKTEDENVALLYSRRCLEVIITDLCECELKRSRGTEPLKGIIDKLNKEEKVPANIVASMHGTNTLSIFGTHPKDFDPEQVKPALNNLAIILKWYLKYKGIEVLGKPSAAEEEITVGTEKQAPDITKLEKSVAILPFRNDSKDEENTYFINGLMEEVLNNLQKIKDLRVISRTSVEQYRNTTKPIPEIAIELGVNYIVEGSGQKYGNAFRMRTQLIMATKESHLWGESYQQKINEVEDIFRIQSQIAESIAKELKAVITTEEKQLIEKLPTKEIEAYDAYLKGRFYLYKFTSNDLDTALKYFELAKEKDQDYALAYSGISFVWACRMQFGYISPSIAVPKSIEALTKAVELDSNNAEIMYSQAGIKTWVMWDWEGGEAAFQKAIELNPNHAEAHAYYSHLFLVLGRLKEAMEQIELALKLDPYNVTLKTLYGIDLLFVRRYDDVIINVTELLRADPSNLGALWMLTYALHLTGRFDEALENWIKSFKSTEVKKVFNEGYTEAGYIGAMRKGSDFLVIRSKTTYVNPVEIVMGYIMAGENERALEWIEHAYEEHNPNIPYLLIPLYDPIRNEPRFQEIARKMNLPYK